MKYNDKILNKTNKSKDTLQHNDLQNCKDSNDYITKKKILSILDEADQITDIITEETEEN